MNNNFNEQNETKEKNVEFYIPLDMDWENFAELGIGYFKKSKKLYTKDEKEGLEELKKSGKLEKDENYDDFATIKCTEKKLRENEKLYLVMRETTWVADDFTDFMLYTEEEANEKVKQNPNVLCKWEYESPLYIEKHNDKQNEYRKRIIEKIKETKTVVTHFGDDLDNKSSVYALERWAKENEILTEDEKLIVERVPAGQVKIGMLNVDTGGHKGSRMDEETIVIDGDPANGVKSAAEELSNLGVYVPEQIVELADTRPAKVSALDSRSGLALVRYLSGKQAFKLAEEELLDKTLTDEQLKEFELTEAHEKQQGIIDTAVQKIEKYTERLGNGDKIVLAPEPITAGSAIAYEKGIPFYASASSHKDKEGNEDGVTFAVTAKPGRTLPDGVIKFGNELVEKYRIDENSSGVFVNPNGQMIVAGGFKNPEFKIEGKTVEGMLDEIKGSFSFKNSLKVNINPTPINQGAGNNNKQNELTK